MDKAELEFYKSGKYLEYANRLKVYAKIPTLEEMGEYNVYPVQNVDGTSSFSYPPPPYLPPYPPPPYMANDDEF